MTGLNEPNAEIVGNVEKDSGESSGQSAGIDKALVLKALREILESSHFHASKQCQKLLSYVVRHSLAGQDNLLRERVIGSQVFGRAPDYDTANDPIVRARAAEVRKRLAQYYISEDHEHSPVRINIPSGSYRALFELVAEHSTGNSAPTAASTTDTVPGDAPTVQVPPSFSFLHLKRRSGLLLRWGFAVALIIAGTAFWRLYPVYSPQEMALRQFWSPAINQNIPVLIYTGTNVVYRLSPAFLNRYRAAHRLPNTGPELTVDLGPSDKLSSNDIQSSSNAYVTVGDVSACAAIVAMLSRRNKPFELRYAGDISPSDLRASPTVLIGAFNNPWTLNVTDQLRFAFARGDTITDNLNKNRTWSVHISSDGSTTDDYAIITRMRNPKTGQLLLTAAGIGQYGTQAASEFLGSPQRIADFAAKAPKGWSNRNLQIVLHIKVADEIPAVVDIAAIYYW